MNSFLVLTFQGYFNTLRMEVNEHDIGVTLVCPGPVQTDVVANAFTEDVNKVHDTCSVRSTLNKHLWKTNSLDKRVWVQMYSLQFLTVC